MAGLADTFFNLTVMGVCSADVAVGSKKLILMFFNILIYYRARKQIPTESKLTYLHEFWSHCERENLNENMSKKNKIFKKNLKFEKKLFVRPKFGKKLKLLNFEKKIFQLWVFKKFFV